MDILSKWRWDPFRSRNMVVLYRMEGVLEYGAMLQIFNKRFFFHDSSVVKKSPIFLLSKPIRNKVHIICLSMYISAYVVDLFRLCAC